MDILRQNVARIRQQRHLFIWKMVPLKVTQVPDRILMKDQREVHLRRNIEIPSYAIYWVRVIGIYVILHAVSLDIVPVFSISERHSLSHSISTVFVSRLRAVSASVLLKTFLISRLWTTHHISRLIPLDPSNRDKSIVPFLIFAS